MASFPAETRQSWRRYGKARDVGPTNSTWFEQLHILKGKESRVANIPPILGASRSRNPCAEGFHRNCTKSLTERTNRLLADSRLSRMTYLGHRTTSLQGDPRRKEIHQSEKGAIDCSSREQSRDWPWTMNSDSYESNENANTVSSCTNIAWAGATTNCQPFLTIFRLCEYYFLKFTSKFAIIKGHLFATTTRQWQSSWNMFIKFLNVFRDVEY